MALHKDGRLDPRRITKVETHAGIELIWLDILGSEAGPYPARNYTFSQRQGV